MDNKKNCNATLDDATLVSRIESRIKKELSFLTRNSRLSREDVEDLAQNIFIKVWTKLDIYSSEKASLDAWIATITKNSLFDEYRKESNKCSTVSLSTYNSYDDEDVDEEGALRHTSENRSDWADTDLDREELIQGVRDTLSMMKDEDSSLLSMYVEDYDGDVMADRLGITANAVYGRIYKCKGRFKDLYKKVA